MKTTTPKQMKAAGIRSAYQKWLMNKRQKVKETEYQKGYEDGKNCNPFFDDTDCVRLYKEGNSFSYITGFRHGWDEAGEEFEDNKRALAYYQEREK